MESLGIPVLTVPSDSTDFQDSLVCQDAKVRKVNLDLSGDLVLLVLKVSQVQWEILDHRAFKDPLESLVHLVKPDCQDPLAMQHVAVALGTPL